jgi:hypothetical protein
MFHPQQKYTGRRYTASVALLTVAFVFVPAVLAASRPFGYVLLSLAAVCSCLCAILAWFSWARWSHVSIPSIEIRDVEPK